MANVKLSASEIELACNQAVILTKQKIINTVYELMGNISQHYISLAKPLATHYPAVLQQSPKIYRGENYANMPWVMLDYPRHFNKEHMFAIRTFFWWGHYCTCSVLISGQYKNVTLLQELQKLKDEYFIGITNNPWQQAINSQNFVSVTNVSQQQFNALPFIQLTKKIPLQEWNNVENILLRTYEQYIQVLTAQTMK